MNPTEEEIRLPKVADFRKYGPLHHIELDLYNPIPGDLLAFIFPYYYLYEDEILDEARVFKLRLFCINLRKKAEYEDYIQEIKDTKELQLRRLEDKLSEKLKNQTCTKCRKKIV